MHSNNFDILNSALINYQPLWQHRAFIEPETPWGKTYPSLFNALNELDVSAAEQLAKDNQALIEWFRPYLPELCEQLSLQTISPSPQRNTVFNPRHTVAIPGRKWQQVSAFSSAIPKLNHPIIEWCSGKAHLGRTLARDHRQAVCSLEFDQTLCRAGQALADQQQVAVELIHHNVLKPLPAQAQGPELAHIGLHACGELHMTLLKTAADEASQQIAISPCCYHKFNHDFYPALSSYVQRTGLTLTKDDIHLVQEETVTAGSRVQKLRHKEQVWRLGFDLLQRQLQQSTRYQTIPSTPKAIFSTDFAHFCHWAADSFNLVLPDNIDYDNYLTLGEMRRQQVVKLDLARQLFRRPLELWLALDRVIFLEEKGYRVDLSEFCERKTTPRNLLIYAQR